MADEPIIITVPGDTAPERLSAIVAAAGGEAEVLTAAAPEGGIGTLGAALDQALAGLGALPAAMGRWSDALHAGAGYGLGRLLLISLVILAVAWGVGRALMVLRPVGPHDGGAAFSARLWSGLKVFTRRVGGLIVFALVAVVLSRLVLSEGAPRMVLETLAAIVFLQRLLYAVFRLIAAPDDPARRLVGLDETQIAHLHRWAVIIIVFAGLVRAVVGLANIMAPVEAGGIQIIGILLWLAGIAVYFFAIREAVTHMIRSRWGGNRVLGISVGEAAPYWPYALLAIAVAVAVQAVLSTLVAHRDVALGVTFQVICLTPFALGAISALREERLATAEDSERLRRQVLFTLAEGAVLLIAAVLILMSWGIQPVADETATGLRAIGPGVVTALVALLLGWVGLRAVREAVALYEPSEDDGEDAEGDGMGKEGSRLGTVLPVLRGFLVTVVGAVAVMVALSALGVSIGPLIAGAGIFGLAIGFGAQKLVADVISGFFFLYEDAFRVGEYIECAEGKGVIERISLRSARLRHHRGSVVTVPFGSMGTVRNHSRDWVKVKFTFEVPDETDVEKVRKIVKRVGVELMEDPLLEDKFLEPLKSQGALEIRGSAYVIGVKYTCRPGDQFIIRRRAYASLQKALKEHGIELHTPAINLQGMQGMQGRQGGKAAPAGGPGS